ncbi:MAG: hypothetical protein QW778_00620 [Candidatus Micrarchaeaceae archaeon]
MQYGNRWVQQASAAKKKFSENLVSRKKKSNINEEVQRFWAYRVQNHCAYEF